MAREAVIVESKRTGLTKANRGSFNITEPVDYLAHTLRAVTEGVPNLDTGDIEDVIVGSGFPEGCQGMNVARIAAMASCSSAKRPRWCCVPPCWSRATHLLPFAFHETPIVPLVPVLGLDPAEECAVIKLLIKIQKCTFFFTSSFSFFQEVLCECVE